MIYSQRAEDPFFTGANDKNPWLFKNSDVKSCTIPGCMNLLRSLTGLSWFIYKPLLIGRTRLYRFQCAMLSIGEVQNWHKNEGKQLGFCWSLVVLLVYCQSVYPPLSKTYLVHFLAIVEWLSYLQADFGCVSHLLGCNFRDLLFTHLFSKLTSNSWLKIHVGFRKESAIRVREEFVTSLIWKGS